MKEKYFEITKNKDSIEGKGRTVGTGICFWEYEDALAFVKSKRYRQFGVMGTTGGKYDIKEHSTTLPKIYTNLVEYDKDNSYKATLEKLRKAELSKLTDKEIKALGL